MRREAQIQGRGAGDPAPRRRSWLRRLAGRASWFLPAALAVLVPKCPLCVASYLAAATGLGFAGKEMCGVPSHGSLGCWMAPAGIALAAAVGFLWLWRARHPRHARR